MAFPSFFFVDNDFALGQLVDTSTLKLSPPLKSSSKLPTYEMKRKRHLNEPDLFKYSLNLINPNTVIEDLSHVFMVPKSFIFEQINSGKLDYLLKHFDGKPGVLVNFHRCDTAKILIPNPNKKESMITRIEYGYQFFAVIQSLCGETNETFKNHVEDSLKTFLKTKNMNYVRGSCVLVFPDRDYNLRTFCDFHVALVDCMKNRSNSLPINVHINVEFNLNDDRNYDRLVLDIFYCNRYAADLLSRVPMVTNQNISKINLDDMARLQHVLSTSYSFPLKELNMVYEYYKLVQAYCKSYHKDIFEIVAAMKSLLTHALQITEKFVFMRGFWFLICDENMLLNAPPKTRFFISNGNNTSTYYETFQKEGWIFTTFNRVDASENDLFYIAGEATDKCVVYSYGIAYSDNLEISQSSPSSRLFIHTCPCGSSSDSNYWICPECKSFFYYHQKRPECVSCKCGNSEISALVLSSSQKTCHGHGLVKYVPFLGDSRRPDKRVYNILIMGPSGAGKSTLINGIANYLKYTTLREAETDENVTCVIPCQFEVQDDQYNSHIVSIGEAEEAEENFNSLGHSVTQKPKIYYFTLESGEVVRVVDTPGLADSRGVEQDSRNLELIRRAIIDVGELHALCFVLKPNESKLTVGLENTMRQLLSIFPKKALESVIFCFTNSRGTFYKPGDSVGPITKLINNLQEERGVKLCFGKSNVFCMDNEGFRFLCARARRINYTTATFKDYEDSWKQSREATLALIQRIKNEKPFDTRTINFYTELACVMKKWAELIPNCKMTYDHCQRFGTIANELDKNLIGADAKDLVQLSEKLKYKSQRFVSDLKGLMNILHDHFVDPEVDDKLANEIRSFLDRYIYQF